ncbi:MFS transporter [Lysinibacillus sphaericus]|uniref:MFS transporter n=1 Tax=Lysinibacillus sphaericus TaxID=1421 RepID=UPI003D7FAFBD
MLEHNKSERKTSRSVFTALTVVFVTILTSTPVFLPGAVNDLIRKDTGFSVGAIGVTITLYWLGSLMGAYISRQINSHHSIDKIIGIAVLVTAFSLFLTFVYPEIGLWVGAAFGGAVYGYSQPFTNMLIIRRCPEKIQGFAFGLKQAAIPAATLFCSLSVPFLAVPIGWRNLFGLVAVLTLFYGIILLMNSNDDEHGNAKKKNATKLRLNRHLMLLAIAGGLGAAIGNSLGGFLITSLTHGGITLVKASMVAAVASLTNILVRVFAGLAIDRFRGLEKILLLSMFIVGSLGTAALTMPSHTLQVVGAILAYGGGWGWAGLLHYVTGAAYPGREGQATAISQMGVSLGAAVGPLIFGFVFTTLGSNVAWLLMSIAGILACISVVESYRVNAKETPIQEKFS